MCNLESSITFETAFCNLRNDLLQRGDLPHVSAKDLLSYIDALVQFPLGRILIEKRSIDPFWTDFIVAGTEQKNLSKLEDFILTQSPFTIAWRELLGIFQRIIQDQLKNGMTLASIPCGAMREILELDYSSISDFQLIGIDIDLKSFSLAKQLAEKLGLSKNLKVYQHDAWQLPYVAELDIIASCGLNIYTPDPDRVLGLYRQFFKALKSNGQLILSFLTYPPGKNKASEWQIQKIPKQDLFLETILYEDVLNAQWRNFRTSDEIEKELRGAGFSGISFHYDTLRVFPTVVATKK